MHLEILAFAIGLAWLGLRFMLLRAIARTRSQGLRSSIVELAAGDQVLVLVLVLIRVPAILCSYC